MTGSSKHSFTLTATGAALAVGLAGAGAWAAAGSGQPPALTALAAIGGAALGMAAGALLAPRRRPAPAEAEAPPAPDDSGLRAGRGREILRRLPNPLIVLDASGEVAFVNDAAAEAFPRAAEGAHFARAFRSPALLDAIRAAFERREAQDVEFDLVSAQEMFVRASIRPLDRRDDAWSDPSMAVLVLTEDHTQARRAEKLHRDFVANASHELKTPLASIAGFIETLQGHAKSDEDARERFLAIMATQADRMKRLVEDLLSLNRIELDEHVRPREVIRLLDVIKRVEAESGPISGGRLRVAFDDPEARVAGDAQQLAQVFQNLIDNALKYSEPGTHVHLRAAQDSPARPGMLGVEVADRGDGIPPEHLTRLTERFYRVSVSRSRARAGTGLGLAIVKHILNRHRGDLEAHSALGEGSVFTVWLPRGAAHSPAEAGNQGARAPAA